MQEKSGTLKLILTASVIVSVLTTVYFVLFEKKNIVMDIEQFNELINSRNVEGWDYITYYYDYALYKVSNLESVGVDLTKFTLLEGSNIFVKLINILWAQIIVTIKTQVFRQWSPLFDFLKVFVASCPVLIFLYKYCIQVIKKYKDNKYRVRALIGTIVCLPLSFICVSLFSPDMVRWFSHGVTVVFMVVLYDIYSYKDYIIEVLNKWREKKWWRYSGILYLIFYAFLLGEVVLEFAFL